MGGQVGRQVAGGHVGVGGQADGQAGGQVGVQAGWQVGWQASGQVGWPAGGHVGWQAGGQAPDASFLNYGSTSKLKADH